MILKAYLSSYKIPGFFYYQGHQTTRQDIEKSWKKHLETSTFQVNVFLQLTFFTSFWPVYRLTPCDPRKCYVAFYTKKIVNKFLFIGKWVGSSAECGSKHKQNIAISRTILVIYWLRSLHSRTWVCVNGKKMFRMVEC